MTDLIRWEDNGHGGFHGYVGTLGSWVYQLWKDGGEWVLQSSEMAGRVGKPRYGDSQPGQFPIIPAGQIEAEVAADWHRLTHPEVTR